ncbi:MAG: hypothetical protein LBI39_04545 [Puniceicoccales bacterium]|nr:hypothetical protein [Puniceicoccales bacterium]
MVPPISSHPPISSASLSASVGKVIFKPTGLFNAIIAVFKSDGISFKDFLKYARMDSAARPSKSFVRYNADDKVVCETFKTIAAYMAQKAAADDSAKQTGSGPNEDAQREIDASAAAMADIVNFSDNNEDTDESAALAENLGTLHDFLIENGSDTTRNDLFKSLIFENHAFSGGHAHTRDWCPFFSYCISRSRCVDLRLIAMNILATSYLSLESAQEKKDVQDVVDALALEIDNHSFRFDESQRTSCKATLLLFDMLCAENAESVVDAAIGQPVEFLAALAECGMEYINSVIIHCLGASGANEQLRQLLVARRIHSETGSEVTGGKDGDKGISIADLAARIYGIGSDQFRELSELHKKLGCDKDLELSLRDESKRIIGKPIWSGSTDARTAAAVVGQTMEVVWLARDSVTFRKKEHKEVAAILQSQISHPKVDIVQLGQCKLLTELSLKPTATDGESDRKLRSDLLTFLENRDRSKPLKIKISLPNVYANDREKVDAHNGRAAAWRSFLESHRDLFADPVSLEIPKEVQFVAPEV